MEVQIKQLELENEQLRASALRLRQQLVEVSECRSVLTSVLIGIANSEGERLTNIINEVKTTIRQTMRKHPDQFPLQSVKN